MPKYIVKDTPIKHGTKGDKEATPYAPGDTVELTGKEAQALGGNVELVVEEKKEKTKKE